MLRKIDSNLWVVEQPQKFMGLEVGTRMTVIRLEDQSLLLISPTKINPTIKEKLDSLGTVKYLIAPNLFHHLYLKKAHAAYPNAKIFAPPDLAIKQPDLQIDKTFTQDPIEFNSEVEYSLLEGFQVFVPPKIQTVNEIVFYHLASKTLIITDSAFNFDDSLPILTQFTARLIGSYQVLKPSWLEKIAVQNKEKLQKSVDKILDWDFQRVIMAHGTIVKHEAPKQLSEAYGWLTK